MKKLSIIAITVLIFTGIAAAQNVDGFEDGNYDQNPEWTPAQGGDEGDLQVTDSRASDGTYSLEITGSGDRDFYQNLAWNNTEGISTLSYDVYTDATNSYGVNMRLTKDATSSAFSGGDLVFGIKPSANDNSDLLIRNVGNGEDDENFLSVPEQEWVTIQLNMNKTEGTGYASAYDSQGNLEAETSKINVNYDNSRTDQVIFVDGANDGTNVGYFDNVEFTGDIPPTATTNPASNVGALQADLNGEANFGTFDGVDGYFRYRKQGDSSWTQTSKQQLSSEGGYSDTVSGLESETTYEYQAVVENETVENGSTETFSTEPIDGNYLTVELDGVADEIRIDASVYEPNKSILNVTVDGGNEYSLSDGENIIEPANTLENYTLLFEWEGDSQDVQSPRVNSVNSIDYQKIVGGQARLIGYSAVALIMLFTVFRIYGMSVRAFD